MIVKVHGTQLEVGMTATQSVQSEDEPKHLTTITIKTTPLYKYAVQTSTTTDDVDSKDASLIGERARVAGPCHNEEVG